MDELSALIGFSFVSSVTPGPNNILLWASGAEFGFGRTIRHVVGTALGIGSMALAVAAGLGAVLTTMPEIGFVMKVAGSAYLLYLAYQIAGARALERGEVARPLGLLQAAAFQAINPKAWIFALGAITTFRPAELPIMAGSVLVAITMMIVVIPTAALWAGGGGVLGRYIAGERANRIVSLCLAVLLAVTVANVWIGGSREPSTRREPRAPATRDQRCGVTRRTRCRRDHGRGRRGRRPHRWPWTRHRPHPQGPPIRDGPPDGRSRRGSRARVQRAGRDRQACPHSSGRTTDRHRSSRRCSRRCSPQAERRAFVPWEGFRSIARFGLTEWEPGACDVTSTIGPRRDSVKRQAQVRRRIVA